MGPFFRSSKCTPPTPIPTAVRFRGSTFCGKYLQVLTSPGHHRQCRVWEFGVELFMFVHFRSTCSGNRTRYRRRARARWCTSARSPYGFSHAAAAARKTVVDGNNNNNNNRSLPRSDGTCIRGVVGSSVRTKRVDDVFSDFARWSRRNAAVGLTRRNNGAARRSG